MLARVDVNKVAESNKKVRNKASQRQGSVLAAICIGPVDVSSLGGGRVEHVLRK